VKFRWWSHPYTLHWKTGIEAMGAQRESNMIAGCQHFESGREPRKEMLDPDKRKHVIDHACTGAVFCSTWQWMSGVGACTYARSLFLITRARRRPSRVYCVKPLKKSASAVIIMMPAKES